MGTGGAQRRGGQGGLSGGEEKPELDFEKETGIC